jgi:hypothetical protein
MKKGFNEREEKVFDKVSNHLISSSIIIIITIIMNLNIENEMNFRELNEFI